MVGDLYLPHEAIWQSTGPRPPADDGVDGGTEDAGQTRMLFFDPLTPAQVVRKFGITDVSRPYLVLGGEDMEDAREGDLIVWRDQTYVIKALTVFPNEPVTVEMLVTAPSRGRS